MKSREGYGGGCTCRTKSGEVDEYKDKCTAYSLILIP